MIRLEGGRQDAWSPAAFKVVKALSTRALSGRVVRSPKSRLTVVEAPAGPRSAARAIAWARVGVGLEVGVGPAPPARPAGAWQAETQTTRARRAGRNFTRRKLPRPRPPWRPRIRSFDRRHRPSTGWRRPRRATPTAHRPFEGVSASPPPARSPGRASGAQAASPPS